MMSKQKVSHVTAAHSPIFEVTQYLVVYARPLHSVAGAGTAESHAAADPGPHSCVGHHVHFEGATCGHR